MTGSDRCETKREILDLYEKITQKLSRIPRLSSNLTGNDLIQRSLTVIQGETNDSYPWNVTFCTVFNTMDKIISQY